MSSKSVVKSVNFQFLESTDPLLIAYAAAAERYVFEDPEAASLKLRKLAEYLAFEAAALSGLLTNSDATFSEILSSLRSRQIVPATVLQLFHQLRVSGNEAAHEHGASTQSHALHLLKTARNIAVWFHKTFKNPVFKEKAFIPPPPPENTNADLQAQLDDLQKKLREEQLAHEYSTQSAADEERRRIAAEAKASQNYADLEAALQIAQETEDQLNLLRKQFEQHLTSVQQTASQQTPSQIDEIVERAQTAGEQIDMTEAETRRLIDFQLSEAGWLADTDNIRYSKGCRPQKGKNLAIAEWPTASGPADYVLFCGLTPIAAVEAKRRNKNVASCIAQAERYSRDFSGPTETLSYSKDSVYKLPFVFSTNGRPYLKQLQELSGIWFRDTRRITNASISLKGWRNPEALLDELIRDTEKANSSLIVESKDYLPLHPFQKRAIEKVEQALIQGRREILLAMATGTGKTRVAICMIYRFLKAGRFRRVLFLVDRRALGEQAADRLKELQIENFQTFQNIYNVKELKDLKADSETRLHIATIQSIIGRVSDAGEEPLAVDEYDCVVIDECHRGYTLDREMSEEDLTFRNQDDYISQYRQALEHFNAVKIGLTATPALHTSEIFGPPVETYSYREAVIDGFLVDHEPPIRISTELSENGIIWAKGSVIPVVNTRTAELESFNAPDEVHVEIEKFNRNVITENFNKAVLGYLAGEIDPFGPAKTIIFCVNDLHADMVVRLLKEEFKITYEDLPDSAVRKITATGVASDKEVLKYFALERFPNIAVTVDLLSTGIDIPAITNIVFLRRVKSRILYEQMLGRATRLKENLYGPGQHKEFFRIYDAVDIYAALEDVSTMKPVSVSPNLSFADLIRDMTNAPSEEARLRVRDQIVAKLQRRRKSFSKDQTEKFKALSGVEPKEFASQMKDMSPAEVLAWFAQNDDAISILDRVLSGDGTDAFISSHADQVLSVTYGYGENKKPSDFLDSFKKWISENLTKYPALVLVTTKPKELTRAQLKEIAVVLDKQGYSELAIRTAWRQTTNQDIAASIVGYIRTAALGSDLIPYENRVSNAVQKVLANHTWTGVQRKWIERIGKQLKVETVVDPEVMNQHQFQAEGGFNRINKIFDGKLEQILGELSESIWTMAN